MNTTMTKNLRNLNRVTARAPPRTTLTTTYPSNTSLPAGPLLHWVMWRSWQSRDSPFTVFMMTNWKMLKLSRFGTMILDQIPKWGAWVSSFLLILKINVKHSSQAQIWVGFAFGTWRTRNLCPNSRYVMRLQGDLMFAISSGTTTGRTLCSLTVIKLWIYIVDTESRKMWLSQTSPTTPKSENFKPYWRNRSFILEIKRRIPSKCRKSNCLIWLSKSVSSKPSRIQQKWCWLTIPSSFSKISARLRNIRREYWCRFK